MFRIMLLLLPAMALLAGCSSNSNTWAVQENKSSAVTVSATPVCQSGCGLLCRSSTLTVSGLPFSTAGLQAQQVDLYHAASGTLIASSQDVNCPWIDILGPTDYQYWDGSISATTYELQIQFLVPGLGLVNITTQPFDIANSTVPAAPAMAIHNVSVTEALAGETNTPTVFAANDPITLDMSASADMCYYQVTCTWVDEQGNALGPDQQHSGTFYNGATFYHYVNLRQELSNLVAPAPGFKENPGYLYRIRFQGTGCNNIPVSIEQIITISSLAREDNNIAGPGPA